MRTLFYICLLLAASLAQAQAPMVVITLPGQVVDRSIYKANAMDITNRERAYDLPFTAHFISTLYAENPHLPVDEGLRRVQQAQDQFRLEVTRGSTINNLTVDQDLRDIIGIDFKLAGVLVGGAAAGVAEDFFKMGAHHLQEGVDSEEKFLAGLQQYQKFSDARDYQESRWDELSKRCDENQNACMVANLALGPRLNARMNDPASRIVENNSFLASNPQVQWMLGKRDDAGSYAFLLDDARQQWTDQYIDLKNMLTADHDLLKEIDKKQESFAKYIQNQEQRQETQARAEHDAQEIQLKYEAANSSVFLLSTILGKQDQKAGEAVRVVGSAIIQVGQALRQYDQTASAFGDLGSSLGGVVLTGNIVSAALNIVGLFGGGPTTDQLILQQLEDLRKEVASLADQMETRFNRLDFALTTIHSDLVARLNGISFTTQVTLADVKNLQQSLFRIDEGLGRLESELTAGFRDAARGQLQEEINFVFRDTGSGRSNRDFDVAENKFFTWAVNTARSPTFAGRPDVPPADLQDASVPVKLNDRGLNGSLNYLQAFSTARLGVRAFSSDQLANPVEWAVGAEAYIQLTRRYPRFDRNKDRGPLEQIRQVGVQLSKTLGQISLVTEGGRDHANHALFDKLDFLYSNAATSFKSALAGTENLLRVGINTDPLVQQANSKVDFWGTASQPTDYVPAIEKIGLCSDRSPRLDPPPQIANLIPAPFRLAEQLGLGKNEVCFAAADFVDVHDVRIQGFVPLLERRGKLAVHLVGRFEDKRTFSILIVAAAETMMFRFVNNGTPSGGGQVTAITDPEGILDENWSAGAKLMAVRMPSLNGLALANSIVGEPELRQLAASADRSAFRRPTLSADLSSSIAAVNKRLLELQRSLYSAIVTSIHSETPLGGAARGMKAAKTVYQSFVALGMSRALERDDALRFALFGKEGIPDGDSVLAAYVSSLEESQSPDTTLKKVDFEQFLSSTQSLLHDHVAKVLSDVDAGTHRESQYLVENMLRRIELQQLARGPRRRR